MLLTITITYGGLAIFFALVTAAVLAEDIMETIRDHDSGRLKKFFEWTGIPAHSWGDTGKKLPFPINIIVDGFVDSIRDWWHILKIVRNSLLGLAAGLLIGHPLLCLVGAHVYYFIFHTTFYSALDRPKARK